MIAAIARKSRVGMSPINKPTIATIAEKFFYLCDLSRKTSQSNKNERITKTNGRSMKYRNTDHGIISTFVKLSFLSMSVMRQI